MRRIAAQGVGVASVFFFRRRWCGGFRFFRLFGGSETKLEKILIRNPSKSRVTKKVNSTVANVSTETLNTNAMKMNAVMKTKAAVKSVRQPPS